LGKGAPNSPCLQKGANDLKWLNSVFKMACFTTNNNDDGNGDNNNDDDNDNGDNESATLMVQK
jgi:hypothetical protein